MRRWRGNSQQGGEGRAIHGGESGSSAWDGNRSGVAADVEGMAGAAEMESCDGGAEGKGLGNLSHIEHFKASRYLIDFRTPLLT